MNARPRRRRNAGEAVVLAVGLLALAGLAAAGLATAQLTWLEDAALFHPKPAPAPSPPHCGERRFADHWLTTKDGETLHAWRVPARGPRRGTVLFFHGNAGNLASRGPWLCRLSTLGLEAVAVDYRGYGASSGSPSEQGLRYDAAAAWRFVTGELGRAPERVVVYGNSLGGVPACWLARARPRAAGLVMQSAFTTLREAAVHLMGGARVGWMLSDRYDNLACVNGLELPLLVVTGGRDRLVPPAMGDRLYAAAPGPKQRATVPGAGHNDLFGRHGDALLDHLGRFVERVLPEAAGPER